MSNEQGHDVGMTDRASLPSDPSGVMTLAAAHRRAGRLAQAEAVYREALETAPEDPDLPNLLGAVLMDQGRLDEAAESFERVLTLRPDHAETHYNLGNACLGLGRLDRGRAHAALPGPLRGAYLDLVGAALHPA